jgi:multiple sugar transport system ATP-binding protein
LVQVKLEDLSKNFGNVKAVDDVNITISDKEFLTLLGPSGCGKTTTLRCIAGLEKPDSGRIYIGDQLVNDLEPKDRNVAMVFQDYALYPHLDVFGNIGFPLKLRKFSKPEIKKRVLETAKLLEIDTLLKRKPKELSGGQRQRVALGRAIIRNPSVFLMDEPLSNLDAKLRIYMRKELKRLQKTIETTLIYVTHDQVEAMTMSDRIAIMHNGRIQQVDPAIKVYNNPKNTFVASFIGSPPMNLINCSLDRKKNKEYLDVCDFIINLQKDIIEILKDTASGSELVLGIRCEDITISSKKESSSIKAEIYVLEPTGSEIIVTMKIGQNLVSAIANPSFISEIGQTVYVKLNAEKIHIFDKKTGKVIV